MAQEPQIWLRPSQCSGFCVTRNYIHTLAGLFWTSDQLVAEATTYTTHNKYKTQPIHALSGAQTRGPGNQAVADLRLRPQGHLVWLFSFTVIHYC
jgi:hypothetical protein